jgi:hypothetical protein
MATATPISNLISSEDVEGTTVYDPSGNKVGEIDHLMIDKLSGNVRYAIMSFGGFLGLGHSHYPLPWSAFRYDTKLEGYVANVTEQQLRDAPEFSDDSWTDREWEKRWHEYFGAPPYWQEGAGASKGSREPMM